jgi:uncharacterized membrane protein YqjE
MRPRTGTAMIGPGSRSEGADIVTLTGNPDGAVSTEKPAQSVGKHAAQPSVGQLVSEASTHFSTLLHSEIELAKLELKSSVKNAGTGAGFFGAALVLLVFSLTFLFIAVGETLARFVVPRWVAFYIVFGFFVLLALLLVLVGIRKVKRVKGPQRTISTSKDTVAYLQSNIKRR